MLRNTWIFIISMDMHSQGAQIGFSYFIVKSEIYFSFKISWELHYQMEFS